MRTNVCLSLVWEYSTTTGAVAVLYWIINELYTNYILILHLLYAVLHVHGGLRLAWVTKITLKLRELSYNTLIPLPIILNIRKRYGTLIEDGRRFKMAW